MIFALTTFYPLKIQVLPLDIISFLRFLLSLMQRYIGHIQFYLTNGNRWVDHKLHSRSRDEV